MSAHAQTESFSLMGKTVNLTGNSNTSGLNFKKQIAMKAFDTLVDAEFVLPTQANFSCPREFRMYKLLVLPFAITENVIRRADIPVVLKKWVTGKI